MTDNDRQNTIKPEMIFHNPVTRRTMLGGSMAAGLGIFGGAMLRGGTLAAPAGTGRVALSSAQEAEATPAAQQVLTMVSDSTFAKVVDFYVYVYQRAGVADLSSESLVRVDKEFAIQPAAAESWESSEDGMTWTFKIREGLMWSDGNPVTANDWVATFQSSADPENAWDFTWYFQGVLKNWTEATAGEVPVEEIGVRLGANDYELVFETVAPAPYLPAMLLYSLPLSAAGLAANGIVLQHRSGDGDFVRSVHPLRVAAGPADHLHTQRGLHRHAAGAGR